MSVEAEAGRSPLPPIRVGLLIGSLEAGGAQRMALRLMSALRDQGVRMDLLCIDRTPYRPSIYWPQLPPLDLILIACENDRRSGSTIGGNRTRVAGTIYRYDANGSGIKRRMSKGCDRNSCASAELDIWQDEAATISALFDVRSQLRRVESCGGNCCSPCGTASIQFCTERPFCHRFVATPAFGNPFPVATFCQSDNGAPVASVRPV